MKAEDDATEVRWLITEGNFMIRQTTGCWQTDDKFVWRLAKETATQPYSTGRSKITIMDVTVRHLTYIHVRSFDVFTSSSVLMWWKESVDWLLPTFRCDVLPLSSWVKWTKWRSLFFVYPIHRRNVIPTADRNVDTVTGCFDHFTALFQTISELSVAS